MLAIRGIVGCVCLPSNAAFVFGLNTNLAVIARKFERGHGRAFRALTGRRHGEDGDDRPLIIIRPDVVSIAGSRRGKRSAAHREPIKSCSPRALSELEVVARVPGPSGQGDVVPISALTREPPPGSTPKMTRTGCHH